MFDVDGTLVRRAGDEVRVIAGAREVLERIRESGRPYALFTNGSHLAPAAFARELRAAGLPVADEQVLSPLCSVQSYLGRLRGDVHVLPFVTDAARRYLETAGLRLVDGRNGTRVDAVFVAHTNQADFDRLELAARAVIAGARLLTGSYVAAYAGADGPILSRGAMITAAIAKASGARPVVVGALSGRSLERAREPSVPRLGIYPTREWWATSFTVPAGVGPSGLPLGVQIVGRRGRTPACSHAPPGSRAHLPRRRSAPSRDLPAPRAMPVSRRSRGRCRRLVRVSSVPRGSFGVGPTLAPFGMNAPGRRGETPPGGTGTPGPTTVPDSRKKTMAASSPVGSFPSPYEVETPPGCEGWEEMYPYYALFDEERRETDEQRFWFWNSMHFPLPMPAFDAICIDTAYQALGSWQNRVFAVPPAMGIDYRCINGYIYISGNPVTDPEKIAERAEHFQKRAGHYFANWDELYAAWRTKMEALIAELEALRVPELREYEPEEVAFGDQETSYCAVLDAYRRVLRLADLMWQNHFEFLLLGYGAYVTFAELCKANLPDIPDQHIAQMVAGLDVLLFRPDAELRRLARLAIDTGVDSAFVEGRSPEEIDAALAESEAGRSWLAELEAVKDPWFHMATGDGLYHYYGSWLDDPTIPYASLTGHIGALGPVRTSSGPPTTSPRSASGSRASTAPCSTTRRGRDSTSCSRSPARSFPTSRSTSSSATTGSSRAGGTRSASSATCSPRTGSWRTARTSSSSPASRCTPRSTSSC